MYMLKSNSEKTQAIGTGVRLRVKWCKSKSVGALCSAERWESLFCLYSLLTNQLSHQVSAIFDDTVLGCMIHMD